MRKNQKFGSNSYNKSLKNSQIGVLFAHISFYGSACEGSLSSYRAAVRQLKCTNLCGCLLLWAEGKPHTFSSLQWAEQVDDGRGRETGSCSVASTQFSSLQNSQPASLSSSLHCATWKTQWKQLWEHKERKNTHHGFSRQETLLIDFKRINPGAILSLKRFTRNAGRAPRPWC